MVVLVLAMVGTQAFAGERCARRPDYVVMAPDAQLDETGAWHRRIQKDEAMTSGHLSHTAVSRMQNIRWSATTEQLVSCLDALIADETSARATKACTVKPKQKH
jgi:hypothetical protein